MDSVCINCIIKDKIRLWFNLFKVLEIQVILLENQYNKDKVGIIKGCGINSLVVRTTNYKAL